MRRIRVIPSLLLSHDSLVKTKNFKSPTYVGDPINAVRIFNEKQVDEIVILDILASQKKLEPNFDLIKKIASECFIPVMYGGGITTIEQMKFLFKLGIEKLALNTGFFRDKSLIQKAIQIFGSQSIVASIDLKKNFLGRTQAYTHGGTKRVSLKQTQIISQIKKLGFGEVLLNSVDRDGSYSGYDLKSVGFFASNLGIPVIASGGASSLQDMLVAVEAGASAVSAGSMFVFKGMHRAVLINYPSQKELTNSIFKKL